MKKILCLCAILLCFTGCGDKKRIEMENEMRKHAVIYYEEYMKGVSGQTENDISIQALKEVNAKVKHQFDLKKLEKCKDSSYVTVIVDDKTREIKDYSFHLDCK